MGTGASVDSSPLSLERLSLLAADSTKGSFGFDKLHVRLRYAVNVPSSDWGSKSDPYVVAEIANLPKGGLPEELIDTTKHRFLTKKNCDAPIWEERAFLIWPQGLLKGNPELKISIVDEDGVWDDTLLDFTHAVDTNKEGTWLNIQPKANNGMELFMVVKYESSDSMIVSQDDYRRMNLQEKVIELETGDLSGGGKAVIRYRLDDTNSAAMLWLPGLNASFIHAHCLDPILRSGLDLYTLDCRRMGLSKQQAPPEWDPLLAHDVSDFDEYIEEIDKAVVFIRKNKDYRHLILYGNSTGGLVAGNYLKSKGAQMAKYFTGLILNGPFFSWDLSTIQETLLSRAVLTDLYAMIANGGKYLRRGNPPKLDGYKIKCRTQYFWPVGDGARSSIQSLVTLSLTTAWAKAVSFSQKRIKDEPPLRIPSLILSSMQDDCLDSEETLYYADFLGPNRTEVQVQSAGHDVLICRDKETAKESLGYILTWLKRHVG